MSERYSHVIKFVTEHPWAILPETLDSIVEVLRMRAGGERFTADEVAERIAARRVSDARAATIQGDIAVLPVHGVLAQRMGMMADVSGGASTEKIGSAFQALVTDPNVGVIILDVDSPGGSVFGIPELGDILAAGRVRKPVVAVANSTAASAAYWLAAQADEIVVTPSGQVGSIGVVAVHEDLSGAAEKAGVKVTHVAAGKFKAEGNRFEPLSEEARAAMQKRVDDYYAMFVRAVARGRKVTQESVRDGFGQGRVVGSADALRLGMADRVGTLEATVARFQKPGAVAAMRAQAELRALEAADPATALARRKARLGRAAQPAALPEPEPRQLEPAPVVAVPERPAGLPAGWLPSR